jgi:protein TonB
VPKDLFAATTSGVGRPKRRWTLIGSIAVHGALLAALIGISVASALDGPQVFRGLNRYVIAAAPPEPPAPPPSSPSPKTTIVANPSLAPLTAPTGFQPEIDLPPSTGDPLPNSMGTIGVGVPAGGGVSEALPSAPPPPVPEIVHIGGNIRPPQRLNYVPPVYPPIALSARVEGTVILEATLDETGAVRDVRVLKSIPLLDRAAIDAVMRWRYSPTRLNGVAVPVVMNITVRFALRKP